MIHLSSLAGQTHFQGLESMDSFRASCRNVRGSNLIGPFLMRNMTSCMLVYIVSLSFFTNAKEIMMAARSRLSDFLQLLLETNFGSKLPVYQSNCSKQLLSILAEEKPTQHQDTLWSTCTSHSMYVANSLCM